jgi:hypothetical protein
MPVAAPGAKPQIVGPASVRSAAGRRVHIRSSQILRSTRKRSAAEKTCADIEPVSVASAALILCPNYRIAWTFSIL